MLQNRIQVENEDKTSRMSIFFRILMKTGMFPLTLDPTEKRPTFKICSRSTLLFTFYNVVVFVISAFCVNYILGFDTMKTFWQNMLSQSNFTDFLTYVVIQSMNLLSSLQFKSFFDICKISSVLLLRKQLHWPKYGVIFLCTTVSCVFAKVLWGIFTIKARIDLNFREISGLSLGYSIQFLWSYTIVFSMFLFFLTWMQHFSLICEEYHSNNIFQHCQQCLQIYKSIQDGLGFTFFTSFVIFQILIVLAIYMFISTAFFCPYDLYTNIVICICYVVIFTHYATFMCIITANAENTHSSLQKLTNPLKRTLTKENDKDIVMDIQLLIQEVETIPRLNGLGYFELKRETLTSIVSNTVTYLIILLQFRTS